MIKLLNPFNHGGVIIPKGTQISLSPELEKALVENDNAEAVIFDKVDDKKPPSEEEIKKQLVIALGKKYNLELLKEAATKAEVTFEEKATKAQIIAAIIEQGKVEELLNEGE
jgi:hypothetical protein